MSYTGTVKWFKGSYGFIITDGDIPGLEKNEVFVYFSGINMEGFKKLRRGQTVKFDVVRGANGFQAINVEVTGDKGPDMLDTDDRRDSRRDKREDKQAKQVR